MKAGLGYCALSESEGHWRVLLSTFFLLSGYSLQLLFHYNDALSYLYLLFLDSKEPGLGLRSLRCEVYLYVLHF